MSDINTDALDRLRELEEYVSEFESCAKAIEYVFGTVTWPSKSLRSVIDRWKGVAPELEPRVLEGDWETVRDALDALPEGAQIRWQEGYPLHSFLGMKTTSVFGDTRWSSVGSDGSFDHLSSTGIAHNDSPVEVIA